MRKIALNAAGTVLVALIDEVNYANYAHEVHHWWLQTIDFATATPLSRLERKIWSYPHAYPHDAPCETSTKA